MSDGQLNPGDIFVGRYLAGRNLVAELLLSPSGQDMGGK
jgi:hypothetical protein